MATEIREICEADLQHAAKILYDGFSEFNTAVNIPVELDFPSVEVAATAVRARLEDEFSQGVVAVEAGRVIAVGFITYGGDVGGISLVAVSPQAANRGAGKAIVSSLMDKSRKSNATVVRLGQAASNTKSFSMYVKLGFRPVEYFNNFVGTISAERAEAAANLVQVSLTGYSVRQMELSDVHVCAKLFKDALGYDREKQIRQKLQTTQSASHVVVKDGTIMGFNTGFTRNGFTIASSEESAIALYAHSPDLHMYILGQLYPRLLRWALESGLRLMRHGTIMAFGWYERPRMGMVWSPTAIN